MRNRSRRSYNSRPGSKGLSLVEAVLGTALLGTLLTGMLLSGAKLIRQGRSSDQARQATMLADRLVSGWWNSRHDVPRNESGAIDGAEGWRWSTSARDWRDPAVQSMRGEIVSVKIYAPDANRSAPTAQVELILPPAVANGSRQ